ncbi:SH3 domain-containing protein [Kovacikia minuta CCNUW1]|uniref:peptidoglycan-binding protein n=1 Tax=Kovacikia minuta TaxID=2931930 RepID=UPI001CCA3E9E|nr:peptidoglycan-binding protein [Kovacikia minuta]UBF24862.1 SH3 domain-containing protein [Kovacikia minuta CCNUW1]
METLAFLHCAIAYEDPNPDPDPRSPFEVKSPLPNPQLVGILAVSVATAAALCSNDVQALMQYGDVGPGVAVLQEDLNIYADQVYGYETERAVRRFQRRNGLQRDGVAGPATLSALGLPADLGPDGGTVPVSGSTVIAYALNVRSYPSLYAPVQSVLYYGETVSLTGASQYRDGYNWVQIARGGWVADDYLSNGGGYSPVSGTAYVSAWDGLYIRSAPDGYIIGGLTYGQSVYLTGDRQYAGGYNWVRLSDGGWVAENYLSYS